MNHRSRPTAKQLGQQGRAGAKGPGGLGTQHEEQGALPRPGDTVEGRYFRGSPLKA